MCRYFHISKALCNGQVIPTLGVMVTPPHTDNVEVAAGNAERIGVDGLDGSGKTTLAIAIAEDSDIKLIHLDEYLERNKDGYVEKLDYESIRRDLGTKNRYVIDGVCLLSVLEKAAIPIDRHIYVKRMSHGLWADEMECDIEEDIHAFIRKEREALQLLDQTPFMPELPGLVEELFRYHKAYKPQLVADVVYTRNDA